MKSSRWRNGWRRRRGSEIRLRDHAPGGMPGRFLFRWRCVFVDEIFGLTPSTGLSPFRGLAVAGLSQRLRALLMNFDATRRSCQRGRERFHPPSHGDTEKFWIGGLGFALSVTFCLCGEEFQIYGQKTRFGGMFVQQLPVVSGLLEFAAEPDQEDGADGSYDNFGDQPTGGVETEQMQQKSAHDGSGDSEQNVYHGTVAASTHDFAG
jgi:hypothetical protein